MLHVVSSVLTRKSESQSRVQRNTKEGHVIFVKNHVSNCAKIRSRRIVNGDASCLLRHTGKSKTPPSKFCPICGDWGKLRINNLAEIFLMKNYLMMQHAKFTAFILFELLRENQDGGLNLIRVEP